MKNCSKKQCAISVVAVFIFMFVYENILHGQLLMGLYKQTASLWRPMEAMEAYFPLMLIRYALLSMLIACLYKKFIASPCCCKGMSSCAANAPQDSGACTAGSCSRKCSICFGVMIGLFMGILQAGSYIWMPIPLTLAIGWFAGALIEGIGIGLVLSFVCSSKGTDKA